LKGLGWVSIQIDGQGLLYLNGAEFNENFGLVIHDNPPSERFAMLVIRRFSCRLENNWQSIKKKLSKLLDFYRKYTGGRTADTKRPSQAGGGINVVVLVGKAWWAQPVGVRLAVGTFRRFMIPLELILNDVSISEKSGRNGFSTLQQRQSHA
jgi:hypothetical protein